MSTPSRLAFGAFELHTDSGELFREGERVPLQHQPAQLLELLARRAGEVVSREEIRERIWGAETYVDSEQGINYCVRQVRQALEDEAATPRFVETVPRRGYRFVAPVAALPDGEPKPVGGGPLPGLRRRVPAAVAVAALAGVLVVALELRRQGAREEAPPPPAPARSALVVPEEAHARFLEARYLVERAPEGDPVADSTRAVELLRAVVREVPEHAEAHAALAEAWLLRLDLPRSEAMANAEEAARRALDLDPGLAATHAVLASALLFHRLDWEGAWETLERALELDPMSADAVFLQGVYLSAVGRHEEAIAAVRRAARLEPGQLPGISTAWFYLFARRFDRAVEEAERILELQPLDEPSHRALVFAHLARGDDAAADRELERFFRRQLEVPAQEPVDLQPVRELYANWWRNRERMAAGTSPTLLASFGAVAAGGAEAVSYLRQACEERTASWDLPFVAVDPRWDSLRSEPGFQEVVDCVGVPGFARQPPRITAPED